MATDPTATPNPEFARVMTLFEAISTAYTRGEHVHDICDNFGVTRSDISVIVQLAGVHRGMDTYGEGDQVSP